MSKKTPYGLLLKTIILNKIVVIFVRNNKKLIGYIRAFDRHMNLILEHVKEVWTTISTNYNVIHHERFILKMILRGDSVILILLT